MVDGIKLDADVESGRNPVGKGKHQIQLECGDDKGRDGRTCLARPNFQARTGM